MINGRIPTVFELADHLSQVWKRLKICSVGNSLPHEIKIGENRDTALIDLLEDETQLPDTLLEQQFVKEDMRELIRDLPEMQAAVISMRYGIGEELIDPMSMTAIVHVLNMSRDRVLNIVH